jgi:8-oxo-dGTP pyrophosphatase MutT (NUDIX family)
MDTSPQQKVGEKFGLMVQYGHPRVKADTMTRLRTQIQEKLSEIRPRSVRAGYHREAAVLIPVFEKGGEPHFLLTRRTEEVKTHKGQISFPGGMRNDQEDLERTALRETFEEVGIEEGKIDLLGRFHDYISVTSFRVVPYAGYIQPPFETVPQDGEVAEILQVPFHTFEDPDRLRVEQISRSGKIMDVYFYRYNSMEIWGLTARIIRDFLGELNLARVGG